MNPWELVSAVSAVALAIAEESSQEELELWAAIFTQLGDTLATIAVAGSNKK